MRNPTDGLPPKTSCASSLKKGGGQQSRYSPLFSVSRCFSLLVTCQPAGTASHVGKWFVKPWQQEVGGGVLFPSPRRKGSVLLGPEPSYSLILYFAENFNLEEWHRGCWSQFWGLRGVTSSCSRDALPRLCMPLIILSPVPYMSSALTGDDGCYAVA